MQDVSDYNTGAPCPSGRLAIHRSTRRDVCMQPVLQDVLRP
jgi:hypothetical protein